MLVDFQKSGYTLLDAERMGSLTPATSNFLAVPKRHKGNLSALLDCWKQEYTEWMT